jgi:hypothetical protein
MFASNVAQAAYYHKNRKKILKQQAGYYRKNRKQILKHKASWFRKNRKKILKQQAGYYRKSRKQISKQISKQKAEYAAVYRLSTGSRHKNMVQRHKHKLAPRGVIGQPMSLKAHRKKLYYADGRERPCWYCLGENNKYGSGLDRLDNSVTYTVKNTVPACRGCNVWRGFTHSVKETRGHFKPMRDAARAA